MCAIYSIFEMNLFLIIDSFTGELEINFKQKKFSIIKRPICIYSMS